MNPSAMRRPGVRDGDDAPIEIFIGRCSGLA